jgi:hypothetical protein
LLKIVLESHARGQFGVELNWVALKLGAL